MGWTRVRFEGTDAPGGLGKAAAREPTITAAMRARASGRAVYSLAFNFDTTLLAVTSDKSTVHVFALDTQRNRTSPCVARGARGARRAA